MLWFYVAIVAYFFSALASLLDKYILSGPISDPRVYSFYVGFLEILILLVLPFVGFYFPSLPMILLSLASGAVFIFSLYIFLKAVKDFEISRIVPSVGAMTPLFVFLLNYATGNVLWGKQLLAFLLVISGSFLINWSKGKINFSCLRRAAVAAFLFAAAFLMAKYVYLSVSFWTGFIWMRAGGFLMALTFLFFREVRGGVFGQKLEWQPKTFSVFLFAQGFGASSAVLQNWAIALVPLVFLPLVNALEGVKYAFLLIFTVFLSLKHPQILKEEISGRGIFLKVMSVLLIAAGLVFLAS